MSKLTIKYQIKVPSILIAGEEVLTLKPIKLTTNIGQITIYPPGSRERKPESYIEPKHPFITQVDVRTETPYFWDADTIWVDVRTDIATMSSKDIHAKSDKEMHELVSRFLRLVRRKLPEAPMPLPTSLPFSTSVEWDREPLEPHHTAGISVPHAFKVVPHEAGLTTGRWSELKQEISSGADTELYEDFVADARVALEEDDLNRATLYSAIACEIFVKEYTEKAAKEASISPKFWEYLKSRQPRVLDYYDSILHLVKGHSLRKENPTFYKLLDQLYEARNKIVHEGKLSPSWSKVKVGQLREDIRRVEQVISWVRGL
jgi:hypothetical protein